VLFNEGHTQVSVQIRKISLWLKISLFHCEVRSTFRKCLGLLHSCDLMS